MKKVGVCLVSFRRSDILIIVAVTAFMYMCYLLMVVSGFCLIHWEDSVPVRTGPCLGYVWRIGWVYFSFMDVPAMISGIALGIASMKVRRTFLNAVLTSLLSAAAPNSCQYLLANPPSCTPYIAGLFAGAVGTLTRMVPAAIIMALLIHGFTFVYAKVKKSVSRATKMDIKVEQ